jgi:intracellular multiplication protein IcmQ
MLDKERMKKEIMDLVQTEKDNFEKKLEVYKQLDDPTEEDYAHLNADWLASLKRIKICYDKNNGKDSLFLRNTITPLLKMLEEAEGSEKAAQAEAADNDPLQYKQRPLQPNQQRVYVVLYQADGGEMSRWVVQLLSLPKLLATRPVYLDEDDARQSCRVGSDTMTKGYISLVVDKDSILQDEIALRRKDQSDKQLVLLKDNAIENGGEIEYLVLGRERYRWLSNQLLPMFA